MKPLFKSKTVWFNVLSGAVLFFGLDEFKAALGPNAVSYLPLAVAGINIALRYITSSAVSVTGN